MIRRRYSWLEIGIGAATTLGMMLSGQVRAQDEEAADTVFGLPLTGKILSDLYAPVASDGGTDFRQLSTSLFLGSKAELDDRTQVVFMMQFDALQSGVSTQLREGYGTYSHKGHEFRLGRVIAPWGKSDAVNPTDVLTGKDFTFLNPDEEVRRRGTQMFMHTHTLDEGNSPLSITQVYAPKPALSTLLITQDALPVGFSTPSAATLPATGLVDGVLALKIAYTEPSWDFDVILAKGWSPLPDLTLNGTSLGLVHHRQTTVGANASIAAGASVFRLESAYLWTENPDGALIPISPSHWDTVVGWERAFWSDFRFQVQGLARFFPAYSDPADAVTPLAPLLQANALLQGYQFKFRPGFTFRLSYSDDGEGLEAEIFTLGNFAGGDYLLRPKLTHAWTDSLRMTLGLDYYGGPKNRTLGAMSSYNSVFAEAKVSF